VRCLIVVLVLVVALAGAYRHYGSPTTGTGTLTLPPRARTRRRRPGLLRRPCGAKRGLRPLRAGNLRGRFLVPHEPQQRTLRTPPPATRRGLRRRERPLRCHLHQRTARGRRDATLRGGAEPERQVAKLVPRLFVVKDGTVRLSYDGFSLEGYAEVRETLEELGPPFS
jgi:hypothetical protein